MMPKILKLQNSRVHVDIVEFYENKKHCNITGIVIFIATIVRDVHNLT